MQKITIDAELSSINPPLTPDEYAQLEANCLADGIRDPLVLWNDTLVDGHNRYQIAQKHGIQFTVAKKLFQSKDSAKEWMIRLQFGRRNLTSTQRFELARMLKPILEEKAKERKERGTNQYSLPEILPEARGDVRDELAALSGISGKTADKIETILTTGTPELKQAMRTGAIKSVSLGKAIADLPSDDQPEIEGHTESEIREEVKKKVHVSANSGEFEWYTPSEIVESSRKVLGEIGLDPSSCEVANSVVKAKKFFTKEDDGLGKEWAVFTGKSSGIFMNPPYRRGLIESFCKKMEEANSSGCESITIVNNATETGWFLSLVKHATAICFPSSRVHFVGPDLKRLPGGPLQGQAIVYSGKDYQSFKGEFSKHGFIVKCNAD